MQNKQASKPAPAFREVSLSKDDRAQFILEAIEEGMPTDEHLEKMVSFIAKTRYLSYKAHLNVGFSEAQAMTLCLTNPK